MCNRIRIIIDWQADANLFKPVAGDCPAYEYDLMIDGLNAEIVELVPPGAHSIPTGVVILEGDATQAALDKVETLPWVDGIAF